MDFKVVGPSEELRTMRCTVATATVIEAGDLVGLTNGIIVKGTAAHTALAYCPKGSANGETVCDVTVGNDFLLEGTGDAVFAVTQKGTEVDLVVNANVQQIDVGESTTDVLKVDASEDAGTAGVAAGIRVRINKPLV